MTPFAFVYVLTEPAGFSMATLSFAPRGPMEKWPLA